MDRFKIDNYQREHDAEAFPTFRSLTKEEADDALRLLKKRLGLGIDSGAEDVLHAIDQKSVDVDGVDATRDDFDLKALLERLGFSARTVLLNWYRFDRIDEFRSEDLCNVFVDIFYPSADDVEIMDSDLTWLLSIRHYGAAKALSLS